MVKTIEIDGKLVTVSRVTSIKPTAVKQVYDLEIENHHNYYANGINVHNCDYHAMLDYNIEKYDDESLYNFKDSFIHYKHRGLMFHPSGPNKRTLRGATRCFYSIDELGWFDNSEGSDRKERASAREVYTALDRSLKTIRNKAKRLVKSGFNSVPTAYALNISSPSSQTDMIMSLVRTHEGSDEVFTVHLPTWKFNPEYTKADFKKEYRDNPINAERDFGANPPMSSNPFIGDVEQIGKLCVGKRNRIQYKYVTSKKLNKDKADKWAEITNINIPTVLPKAILALDAGYCVSGDTLIPTDKGLLKIKELEEHRDKKITKNIDIVVGSNNYNQHNRAVKWHYSGIKPLIKIVASNGSEIKVTPEHKLLVLNKGLTVWKKAKDVKQGDLLCYNPNQPLCNLPLKLNLSTPLKTCESNSNLGKKKKFPIKPNIMTPDLAYIIGALISEGNYSKYTTCISNTHKGYIKKIKNIMKSVFDLECLERIHKKGEKYKINGVKGKTNTDCFELIFCSKILSDWWVELGLINGSQNVVIPDCILQADSESQKSFLAAYIEGDGSIRKDRYEISIWSSSNKLLPQLSYLLGYHGIFVNRSKNCLTTGSSEDAVALYTKIHPYLEQKRNIKYLKNSQKSSYKYGFPSFYSIEFIKSRCLKEPTRYKKGEYLTDDGKKINMTTPYSKIPELLVYSSYRQGKYDNFLQKLRLISPSYYKKLVRNLNREYRYPKVVSINKSKPEPVYDLTMEKTPSFIGNGLVIHNSNNSFAAVVGHIENMDTHRPTYVIDAALEIAPRKNHDVINFTKVAKFALGTMIQELNVVHIVADRWNSIKLLQDCEEEYGVGHTIYSMSYSDFIYVREFLQAEEDKQIILPRSEMKVHDALTIDLDNYPHVFQYKPIAHFLFQCGTVVDYGSSVEKGDGTTDDVFRSICLALAFLTDEEFAQQNLVGEKSRGRTIMGAVAGKSNIAIYSSPARNRLGVFSPKGNGLPNVFTRK